MSEHETGTEEHFETEHDHDDEQTPIGQRFNHMAKFALRRLVVLISFGPGVLGVLWLLGRILRR